MPQERQKGKVEWNHEVPIAVKLAVDFMYSFEYACDVDGYSQTILPFIASDRIIAAAREANREAHVDPSVTPSELGYLNSTIAGLECHLLMHTLADAYVMPDLQRYAQREVEIKLTRLVYLVMGEIDIRRRAPSPRPTFVECRGALDAWFAVVEYIYGHASPITPGLRKSLFWTWNSLSTYQKQEFGRERWAELVERFPDLATDLIVGFEPEVTRVEDLTPERPALFTGRTKQTPRSSTGLPSRFRGAVVNDHEMRGIEQAGDGLGEVANRDLLVAYMDSL